METIRYFSKYTVNIVDQPFTHTDALHLSQTARITFFDEQGAELHCLNLGYMSADSVRDLLKGGGTINLDYCYIPDFLGKEQNDTPSESLNIQGLSAKHTLFDSSDDHIIDFSSLIFEGDVNFNSAFFFGSTSFNATQFLGDSSFDYALFEQGHVDFSQAVFKGQVSFKNTIFKSGKKLFESVDFGTQSKSFVNTEFGDGDVSFAYANFNDGRTSFKVARFGEGKVDFHSARFGDGEFLFERAIFGDGDVIFRSAQFGEGKIDFTRSEFGKGDISFVNTKFGNGNTSFVNTEFNAGKVSFKLAEFGEGKVDMHYATFGKGDIIFDRTIFGDGEVDFSAIEFNQGRISFNRSEFGKGDISLEASLLKKGRLHFKRTIFGVGSINFENIEYENANIIFDNVNFARESLSFKYAKINHLEFNYCSINNYFDLRVAQCNNLDLSNTIIRDIIDLYPDEFDADIRALNLAGIRLLGRIYLDWNGNNVKKLIYNQESSLYVKSEQFRVLKENYNALGLYKDEDEAYVEFKRTEAKANLVNLKDSGFLKRMRIYWQYAFQWLVFDRAGLYATNPIRVFFSMLVAYSFFTLLYLVLPLFTDAEIVSSLFESGDPNELSYVTKALYHSAITFLTIGYGDYYPHGIHRWLSSIEGFVGLFLMSYFTVAFVRKILR